MLHPGHSNRTLLNHAEIDVQRRCDTSSHSHARSKLSSLQGSLSAASELTFGRFAFLCFSPHFLYQVSGGANRPDASRENSRPLQRP